MVVLSQQVKSRLINSYALIAVESGLKCLLIVQFRFCGHGKPWYRERWFPPLQKAQGRGTLSDGGARKIKGGPPARAELSDRRKIMTSTGQGERSVQASLRDAMILGGLGSRQ
jgi:hypothetical protein